MVTYKLLTTPPNISEWTVIHRADYSTGVGTGNQVIDLSGGEVIAGDTDKVYMVRGRLKGTGGVGVTINLSLQLNTSNGNYYSQRLNVLSTTASGTVTSAGDNWPLASIGTSKLGILNFAALINCDADSANFRADVDYINRTDHVSTVRVANGELNSATEITSIHLLVDNSTADTVLLADLFKPSAPPTLQYTF